MKCQEVTTFDLPMALHSRNNGSPMARWTALADSGAMTGGQPRREWSFFVDWGKVSRVGGWYFEELLLLGFKTVVVVVWRCSWFTNSSTTSVSILSIRWGGSRHKTGWWEMIDVAHLGQEVSLSGWNSLSSSEHFLIVSASQAMLQSHVRWLLEMSRNCRKVCLVNWTTTIATNSWWWWWWPWRDGL